MAKKDRPTEKEKVSTILEELFKAKAHLGHKTNRIHPKARKYIYSIENGVSIIDLSITVKLLEEAKEFVYKLSTESKKLLVVSTKKIASNYIQTLCQSLGISYITHKWPAGLLTNFETITRNIKRLKSMRDQKEKDEWNKFVKHDRLKLQKDLIKLEKHYGGLADLQNLPDALYIIDVKKEKNAVSEARKNNIPIVAIVDTNVNPQLVDYSIPANDDSLSSVEYISKRILEAYAKARDPVNIEP